MTSLKRPNILLVLVDEQRAARPYDPHIRLPAMERLVAQGLSFRCHYTAATACAPSRTSLFTGHYPSVHGVSQTDGMAKSAEDVRWLAPDSLPTLGHYLRLAGYRTHYRGKWHVSHADLLDKSGAPIPTNDKAGRVLSEGVRAYRAADPLDRFGFTGWIGPEPHGADPANTGFIRDPLFTEQIIEQLRLIGSDPREREQPFFFVASLVNPHDIAVYSQLWSTLWDFPWPDDSFPEVAPPPTADEDLSTKPRCQKDYVDKYWRMLMPQFTTDRYRRFYYWLQGLVDAQIGRILDALEQAGLRDDTLVIFTSDHGDMLGAHGGMHQKWHNAYEETIHVPLIVSNPVLFPSAASTSRLTSHIDLLPTILALAGTDFSSQKQRLEQSHSVVLPPAGRDLSALLKRGSSAPAPDGEEFVYFMSDDQVSDGGSWLELGALKLPYRPVIQPGYVETVVARLNGAQDPSVWKYSRYFDGKNKDQDQDQDKGKNKKRNKKQEDEYELYNLTEDPLEERNLAHPSFATSASAPIRAQLDDLLGRCHEELRLSDEP